ncbi:MAG: TIGR00269 family protein [Chloroflexi bacterium]|nr:TIGR00269 family protein [Chloroflexota bacterium]
MRCVKCRETAWVDLPSRNAAYCGQHYIEYFEGQTGHNIRSLKMFTPEDRILVAVSGGKDSLTLWEVLMRLGYKTTGFHIHLGIGVYSDLSREKTEAYARARNVDLIVVEVDEVVGATVPEVSKTLKRVPCSGCGLIKRYLMNRTAREHGFTVLATGHNLDDEAATLMGGVLHWQMDSLGRQAPALESTHPRLGRKVKPLYTFSEKETASYAVVRRIDYVVDECPNAVGALSLLYKDVLNKIEAESPGTKLRFFQGYLKNLRPVLDAASPKPELRECATCGEATTTEVCAYCRMVERVCRWKQRRVTPASAPSPAPSAT